MRDLLNLLSGLGATMNPFGSAPQYSYPSSTDRLNDSRRIAGDFSPVGERLKSNAESALRQAHDESVNDGADQG